MKTVFIISRCIKKTKNSYYVFHFKGVYLGHQVNSLHLECDQEMIMGNDYVMEVKVDFINDKSVLCGKVQKLKDLETFTSH